MGQTFRETAHLNIDKKKYEENYDKIFNKKTKHKKEKKTKKEQPKDKK